MLVTDGSITRKIYDRLRLILHALDFGVHGDIILLTIQQQNI